MLVMTKNATEHANDEHRKTTVIRWPKKWHICFVRLNFIKYQPIFKIISLSESGENV